MKKNEVTTLWKLGDELFNFFSASCLSVTCFNKTDGVYEENCRAYTRCSEGVEVVVNCEKEEAFNTNTKICER